MRASYGFYKNVRRFKKVKNQLGNLQKLGKALMAPVAVLPAAALLLRLGAPDVFNVPIVMAAGDAIFGNLPLIFALGVSMGLASGAEQLH